ncbi:MAG: hypothetical protein ABI142_00960 [Bryocella sp.]
MTDNQARRDTGFLRHLSLGETKLKPRQFLGWRFVQLTHWTFTLGE